MGMRGGRRGSVDGGCKGGGWRVELEGMSAIFVVMRRRPQRSTPLYSSAASDVYKGRVPTQSDAIESKTEKSI